MFELHRRNHAAASFASFVAGVMALHGAETEKIDPLKTAHDHGDKLKKAGYVYPQKDLPKDKTNTVDCTQFVLQVAKQLIPDLPRSAIVRITMNDLKPTDVTNNVNNILATNLNARGIQQALVSINRGEVVALTDVKPGDFMQYWMKTSTGAWFGHAGIVEKVENGQAWLYGSHKSAKGIGTAPKDGLTLKVTDDRFIYPVRLKPEIKK